ncbi:hypothetical protein P7C73_g4553, partial [Tremellales sp. Uapishka_1]
MSATSEVRGLGLSSQEMDEVFGSLDIRSGSRAADCQHSVATRLREGCRADAGGLAEESRSGFAISLTLCSMRSALQPLPSECSPWSPFSSTGLVPKKWQWRKEKENVEQRAKCLGALHRSPQDWSSYNGYLSDASGCAVIEAREVLIDILLSKTMLRNERSEPSCKTEMARQTYLNATLEKIALINLLRRNEEHRKLTEDIFRQEMEQNLEALHRTATDSASSLQTLQTFNEHHSAALQELQMVKDDLREGSSALWQSLELGGREKIDQLLSAVEAAIKLMSGDLVQGIDLELNRVVSEHTSGLSDLQIQVRARTASLFEESSDQVQALALLTETRMNAHREIWDQLAAFVSVTKDDMSQVAQLASELSPALSSALNTASSIQVSRSPIPTVGRSDSSIQGLQEETARTMELNLFRSRALTEDFQTHFVFLNESLEAVALWKAEMLQGASWGWSRLGGVSLFSAPALISPTWVTAVGQNHHLGTALRCLEWILGVVIQAALLAVYGLTSVLGALWLILYSGVWRVIRRLSRKLWSEVEIMMYSMGDEEVSVASLTSTVDPVPKRSFKTPSTLPPVYSELFSPLQKKVGRNTLELEESYDSFHADSWRRIEIPRGKRSHGTLARKREVDPRPRRAVSEPL